MLTVTNIVDAFYFSGLFVIPMTLGYAVCKYIEWSQSDDCTND